MFITHFNRLIRNKFVWTAFAFLVVISFIGVGVTRKGCRGQENERGSAGLLFGNSVSINEFNNARFFELGLRENRVLTPAENRRLQQKTWIRLAALHMADEMGLNASVEDVSEAIAKDPTFAVGGVFSRDQYERTVRDRLRVEPDLFERFVKESLTLQRVLGALSSMLWSAPEEVNRRLNNLTDRITVDYVVVTNDIHVTEADLTPAAITDYLAEHKGRYMQPERVRVKYVAFPSSNYVDAVEVGEQEILDFYDDRIEEYSRKDTNNVAIPIPLDQVRTQIVARLKVRESLFKAKDAATEFAVALTPDRAGRAQTFDEAAVSRHMTVCTSEYFSADESMTNLLVGAEFNKSAFALDPADRERYFSDAVTGERAAYVMAIVDKQDAREPTLEEVRGRVVEDALRNLRYKKFLAKVGDLRTVLTKALGADTNASFLAAAKTAGYAATTNAPFSIYEGMDTNCPYADVLTTELISLKPRELTEPIPVDGGALLACITVREPGDASAAQLLKPQLLRTLERYRVPALYDDWGRALLAQAKFKSYLPAVTSEEEAEADEKKSPSPQTPKRAAPLPPVDTGHPDLL